MTHDNSGDIGFNGQMNIGNLKLISSNFLQELRDANNGKETSLRFIVHNHSSKPIVADGEIFQVMVIGGSVFKKAVCKKINDKIEIIRTEKPVGLKTKQGFLKLIDRELSNDVKVLALNFAYPLKPVFANSKLDGILLASTKERGLHGLVGKKIGEEIEKYILEKRKQKIKVSVANDTICLLLSGLTKYSFENLAAGIVGTGLNFAFFLDKYRLVNLESANFDKFPQSTEGKLIDQESSRPHKALFEKETAGAYLYKHFNLIIKEKGLKYSPVLSTKDLNEISLKHIPNISSIAQNLIKRSAQLVACQIAGITEFKKQNPTSSRLRGASMVFNMEGSLFWKGNNYKETVERTIRQLIPEHHVKFVEIENSAILGAAKLVI